MSSLDVVDNIDSSTTQRASSYVLFFVALVLALSDGRATRSRLAMAPERTLQWEAVDETLVRGSRGKLSTLALHTAALGVGTLPAHRLHADGHVALNALDVVARVLDDAVVARPVDEVQLADRGALHGVVEAELDPLPAAERVEVAASEVLEPALVVGVDVRHALAAILARVADDDVVLFRVVRHEPVEGPQADGAALRDDRHDGAPQDVLRKIPMNLAKPSDRLWVNALVTDESAHSECSRRGCHVHRGAFLRQRTTRFHTHRRPTLLQMSRRNERRLIIGIIIYI